MASIIAKAAAAPIRLLAGLAEAVKIFDTLPLRTAVWKLSGTAEDASALLALTWGRLGVETARARAKEILARTPDCTIAATIGDRPKH